MYHQRQQKIQEEHVTVTRALEHINKENKLASKLQKQLEHELVVLEERKEVRGVVPGHFGRPASTPESATQPVP